MSDAGVCDPPSDVLAGDEIRELEPLLSDQVGAGFVLPGERWVEPGPVLDGFARALRVAGVEIREGVEVRSVDSADGGARVYSDGDLVEADVVVVAAGVWSRALLRPLGLTIPMQPGKGYSFSVRPSGLPSRVIYFPEPHVMTSPAGDRMRVGGTMEFDGTTDRFAPRRIEAIARGLRPWFADVDLDARHEEWVGARPMTPDGLPVIGCVPGQPNIVVATGHCMLGLTLGPVTGQIVERLVASEDPGLDLTPFAPARF
jgi:D-amino-acid dehydrogenase